MSEKGDFVVRAVTGWARVSGGGETADIGRQPGNENGQPVVAAVDIRD